MSVSGYGREPRGIEGPELGGAAAPDESAPVGAAAAVGRAARAGAAAPTHTVGRYEGVRRSDGKTAAFFDAQVDTFTGGQGKLQLICSFQPTSPSESRRVPHADLFLMQVPLSLEDYKKLFEASGDAKVGPLEGLAGYRVTASATTNGSVRTIVIDQEAPEKTRRGRLTVQIEDGKVASFRQEKWAKRLFGYDKVLDDTVGSIKKTKDGLALRDEGEHGRAKGAAAIHKAITASGTAFHP